MYAFSYYFHVDAVRTLVNDQVRLLYRGLIKAGKKNADIFQNPHIKFKRTVPCYAHPFVR